MKQIRVKKLLIASVLSLLSLSCGMMDPYLRSADQTLGSTKLVFDANKSLILNEPLFSLNTVLEGPNGPSWQSVIALTQHIQVYIVSDQASNFEASFYFGLSDPTTKALTIPNGNYHIAATGYRGADMTGELICGFGNNTQEIAMSLTGGSIDVNLLLSADCSHRVWAAPGLRVSGSNGIAPLQIISCRDLTFVDNYGYYNCPLTPVTAGTTPIPGPTPSVSDNRGRMQSLKIEMISYKNDSAGFQAGFMGGGIKSGCISRDPNAVYVDSNIFGIPDNALRFPYGGDPGVNSPIKVRLEAFSAANCDPLSYIGAYEFSHSFTSAPTQIMRVRPDGTVLGSPANSAKFMMTSTNAMARLYLDDKF